MIPLQLTLKNFLSYRQATLDFRGLHTACICGANGAGKSSLLEAITWVLWGESRASSDDHVIHTGADYVSVDFQFISNQQTYRVIRYHSRGRNSSLEFQIASGNGFRSITAKGVRATQEHIIDYLKLDYDTFINSAYLRQGRADEFMLRRPSERKQILADLLKLDQYEELANQAKDLSKQFKGQADQLELNLEPLKNQIDRRKEIELETDNLREELEKIKQEQQQDLDRLKQLQSEEHQRQAWYQQLTWQQTQYQNLQQDCQRLKKEQSELEIHLSKLQNLIAQEGEITKQYQQLLHLQKEEEDLAYKFQIYQEKQQQKQQLEQQLSQKSNQLKLQLQQLKTRLEGIEQQEKEIQQTLSRSEEVQSALEKLRHHRKQLQELDKLQHQVSPLLQRSQILKIEIEQVKAHLKAKLEQLNTTEQHYIQDITKIPEIRQVASTVDQELQNLEKKQVYQKRVEEKGQERKSFQERLEARQRIFEEQIEELKQKLDLLETPEANCPLCEQELDNHHRHQVITKTEKQQTELQEQIWVLQEQMTVCTRELQILRTEYAQLNKELAPYASLRQKFGQLEAQLEAMGEINSKLKQLKIQKENVERSLSNQDYAQELQLELESLQLKLKELNYDEQTHALVRGEVERLHWAEIKQAKIEEANRRKANLDAEKPKLLEKISRYQTEIENLHQSSEIQQKINQLNQDLTVLGYDRISHQNLLHNLRKNQTWQLRYQELQQAQQIYPQEQQRRENLLKILQEKLNYQLLMKQQLEQLNQQMEQLADPGEEMQNLEQKIQQRRQNLDELLAQKGRLEQTLNQLENLKIQAEETRQQLKEVRQKYRIYKELAQAFGKNGIQTLIIENILPNLEAQTNQILARLTGNQLHIQFVTQKSGKSKTTKLIDTLEILIADARGTRPYETYSGGEAFRINFAIRLALAKLLAQRAGTSLQLLIVDEGFGTQDADGCERLVASINAIAADFACILTVTHMPQFKEAFQHRIEIYKTNQGSQISLLT